MEKKFKNIEIVELEKWLVEQGFNFEEKVEFTEKDGLNFKEMNVYLIIKPEKLFVVYIFKGNTTIVFIESWKEKEDYCVKKEIKITHDLSKTKELIKKEVEEWKK